MHPIAHVEALLRCLHSWLLQPSAPLNWEHLSGPLTSDSLPSPLYIFNNLNYTLLFPDVKASAVMSKIKLLKMDLLQSCANQREQILARMADERLLKRVLFGYMDGSGVRDRIRSNGWSMSGKTCSLQGFRSHSGGHPKTGQAEGLP